MKALLSLILLVVTTITSANETPLNWPWKGINVKLNYNNDINEDIIKNFSSIGINTISVNFIVSLNNDRNKVGSGQKVLLHDIQNFHRILNYCKKYGIGAILTFSSFPLEKRNRDYNEKNQLFWDNSEQLDRVFSTINLLSKEFSGRGGELLAYKFLSEPFISRSRRMPNNWRTFQEKIIRTVRKNDKSRWIVVTSGPGGSGNNYAKNFKPFSDNKIIYGAHFYKPHKFTHQGLNGKKSGLTYSGFIGFTYWDKDRIEKTLSTLINYQKKHKVPIFIGEFGLLNGLQGGESYIKDTVDVFDKYKFGWAFFLYNGYKGFNIQYKKENGRYIFVGHESKRYSILKNILQSNK